MKKHTTFKLIAITFPLLIILLLEIGLRLGGYGTNYNLFNTFKVKNQPDYLVMNSAIGKKYFRDKKFNPDNEEDLFLAQKSDNTFRVFVQGASTVVGFPFYQGGSFPNMLKHRLSQTFPFKNIEVINTAMTAVNSYTLLDFTDEIIEQKPDAVIIYAGHNEFYGALGVGSTSSIGSHPAIVRMYLSVKNLRLFQLLETTYINLILLNGKSKRADITMMERMVKQQRIPLNSDLYRAGITQYESNLDKILQKYHNHHIPVIISTLVSNEKDIKPFISDSIIEPKQYLSELKQNSPESIALAEHNAMAAYLLGQYYWDTDKDAAQRYYHKAKELDLLRFRAPEKINEAIVKLAAKYDCQLVNMKSEFLNYTGKNIVDNALLTEHVHPNIEGHFIMADAFYRTIKEMNLLKDWRGYIGFDEAFNDIPVTNIDSLRGMMVVENLKKSWPFDLSKAGVHYESAFFNNRKPTYEEIRALEIFEGVRSRDEVMKQSYQWYHQNGQLEQCLRIVQTDIINYPELTRFYRLAGNICIKMNDLKKATYYFIKYHQYEKSSQSAQELAKVYLQSNQKEEAIETLQSAIASGLKDKALMYMLNAIK